VTKTISGGSIGVWGFFFISGFLVTESYLKTPQCYIFLVKRFLRIWPGLTASLILSVILAYITCSGNHEVFFQGAKNYLANNILLFKGILYTLPGAFPKVSFPSVNGSLWTLPWEVRMYILVAVLGVTGILLKRECLNLALILIVIIVFAESKFDGFLPTFDNSGCTFMIFAFLLGMATCTNTATAKYDHASLLLIMVSVTIIACSGFTKISCVTIICSIILFLGFSRKVPIIMCNNDISYGIYIYSFPVQQFIINQSSTHSPIFLFFMTMPVVIVLAYLSWNFLEKPFLRLKPKDSAKTKTIHMDASYNIGS